MNSESESVEFKPSLSQIDNVIETISAFSNKKGGRIEIGRKDDGTAIGVQIGKDTVEKLSNQIKQNTDPPVYPSIKVAKIAGKDIIVIFVEESKSKPVFAYGKAFKRVGKSNHRLSKDEIRKLMMESSKVYWDEQICKDAIVGSINNEKVRWFLERARYERRLEIDPRMSVKEALTRLELVKNGKLTNAAVLLFGKNPQKHFIRAETRCARFKGTEPIEFIDMKVFGGDIIDQRDSAIDFVKEHIQLHAKIVGTERVETWEYPMESIRESITNAICHRDYELSSNVQIRIFDDRIEVWGCGGLPESLTVDALKTRHRSIPRNRLIAKSFFLIKYIEQWGTGTNRIIEECVKHGLPEPSFEEIAGDLVVTFNKSKLTDKYIATLGLNERQKKALAYVKEKGSITNREYVSITGSSKPTATRDLSNLVERNILETKGAGKRDLTYVLAGAKNDSKMSQKSLK